jgi:diguanylate cyclase (GGDEF)-like protein
MDKRSSTRYAINLNALVHPSVGRSWLCQIEDFCEGGMLLVEQNNRPRRSLPGINTGETVGIHFSVPTDTKDQHFRLEGKIVRVMDTGVGISFANSMDEVALTCLSDHSGLKPAKLEAPTASASKAGDKEQPSVAEASVAPDRSAFLSGGLKPDDSKRIVALLRKEAAKILAEMNTSIFTYMDTELLELAKDAKSNAEQSEYFAAMSALEKGKKVAGQEFIDEVLNQFDEPRDLQSLLDARKKANEERKAQSQKRIKLSLINTDEFEDWLAVANVISRSERMYEKYLGELLRKMGLIVDSWGHSEANPLGAAVFTHAFDSAIQKIDVSKEIRQKIYTGYDANILPLFRKLYINTIKMLEESGLFPDAEDDYVSPAASSSSEEPETSIVPEEIEEEVPVEKEEILEEEEAVEDDEDLLPEFRSKNDPEPEPEEDFEDDYEEEPVRPTRRRRSSRRRRQAPESQPVAASSASAPRRSRKTEDMGDAIRNIYSSVRELMGGKGQVEEQYEEDVDFFEADEIQDLLSTLEEEAFEHQGRRMPVRQRLMETASLVGGRRVSPSIMQNLEVVENLVDTMEDDAMLSGSAKNWIRELELTLDKVAATQDDFLNERNPHRSMEVVNQLARLSGAETGSAKRAIDEIVSEITTGYDEDPEVFDRAMTKLQPLVERQNKAFTGNVQRTVKASEGQQTLVNAQRAVVSEMDQRYAGREIPEVLYKLLMPGWRNLLVNTHLREGEESSEWNKHVQAMDQVFQYLDDDSDPTASPDYMEPDELLRHIESGLDSISYEPGQRIPLINSLRSVIQGDVKASDMPTVALKENTIAENLGFSDVNEVEKTRKKIREDNEDDSGWKRSYNKIQRLHVGAWAEFLTKAEPEISIVAWMNEEVTRFVFVNRRGVKTHDISVEELATLLQGEKVRILEESDIPITERASHRMLQNMHNQLTHQATHDDLTGLVNRKEFERELEEALDFAKREEQINLCAYLDLDQFKVINNTGGHDAGDRLLVIVAELLRDQLNFVDAKLARLGGDEFGILVRDCDRDTGSDLMKAVSEAIKAVRFEWENDTFSLTTSTGVYYMTKDTADVTKIMSSADAACIAAKEAGRDRIQEYKEDDTDMGHRLGIMEFVSQIDRALDEDRFELNCQMIKPIDEDNPDVHYEILLTVLDEDDTPLPPQDFIVAAEKFNRMGAVDRWVIRNAFKFIASNILKLDHLGAFSINISGNSLTEADFMEFVLEQFDETKLPTSKICFEITETAAIGNLDEVVEFMEKMKILGVQFSLDDFGTGLSSYSYLKTLPVDYLKIDGIFVKDIKDNPSDYAVVKSINEIGHAMGKKTIAEYVENDEIIEILREIGVDYAQGWGVGKKVPIVELLK